MKTIGNQQIEMTLFAKFRNINWILILLVIAITGIGLSMLYSVSGGDLDPWASRQLVRFSAGFLIMLVVAFVDVRTWYRLAYPIYGVSLIGLISVELIGSIGMGAQRWIDLGLFTIQPSELMKVALILALARYFHGLSVQDIGRIRWLIVPAFIILVPATLVLIEPDLGTALLIVLEGLMILFIVGVRWWKFFVLAFIAVATWPVVWGELHLYQKKRILTFFQPETDPLGAGYHIMQSKIALGSGGVWGKGFLLGTQSHLNFLPEKHTDFIFTTLAEELGLMGGLGLLSLYVTLVVTGTSIAIKAHSQFARTVAIGVTATFFLYVFINIAMVMGLVPVVGVPLPLVSYGGTAMLTILIGVGLLLSVHIHRDVKIAGRAGLDAI